MNQAALRQARLAVQKVINENPEEIKIIEQPKINNGFGDKMDDPFSEPLIKITRGRFCDSSNGIDFLNVNSVGFGDGNSSFLLMDYKSAIKSGLTIEGNNSIFKILNVNPIYRFGGLLCYQCLIKEINNGNT